MAKKLLSPGLVIVMLALFIVFDDEHAVEEQKRPAENQIRDDKTVSATQKNRCHDKDP